MVELLLKNDEKCGDPYPPRICQSSKGLALLRGCSSQRKGVKGSLSALLRSPSSLPITLVLLTGPLHAGSLNRLSTLLYSSISSSLGPS